MAMVESRVEDAPWLLVEKCCKSQCVFKNDPEPRSCLLLKGWLLRFREICPDDREVFTHSRHVREFP